MSRESTGWEYRIEQGTPADTLDQLGAEGWELVGVDGREPARFIFKRPARSFVERVTLEQRARYFESLGIDPDRAR